MRLFVELLDLMMSSISMAAKWRMRAKPYKKKIFYTNWKIIASHSTTLEARLNIMKAVAVAEVPFKVFRNFLAFVMSCVYTRELKHLMKP